MSVSLIFCNLPHAFKRGKVKYSNSQPGDGLAAKLLTLSVPSAVGPTTKLKLSLSITIKDNLANNGFGRTSSSIITYYLHSLVTYFFSVYHVTLQYCLLQLSVGQNRYDLQVPLHRTTHHLTL